MDAVPFNLDGNSSSSVRANFPTASSGGLAKTRNEPISDPPREIVFVPL